MTLAWVLMILAAAMLAIPPRYDPAVLLLEWVLRWRERKRWDG
jgi:hypothetical protein